MASQHDDDVYESPATQSPDERSVHWEDETVDGEIANTFPVLVADLEKDVNVGYFVDDVRADTVEDVGGANGEPTPLGYLEDHDG